MPQVRQAARPAGASQGRTWRRVLVGAFRLVLLAAALFALKPHGADDPSADPAVLLSGARGVMPDVSSLGAERDGLHELLDAGGNTRGWVTTTFPHAAKIHGYNGPSELMVVLDTAGKVRSVKMLQSADTIGHVEKVLADPGFWEQWTGRTDAVLGDLGRPRIVSGATLTSEAMARGVAARFGATGLDEWFTKTIDATTVARWFPKADRIEADQHPGVNRIFHGQDELGIILRSSRMGVGARGFNGVSDVLVAIHGETVLGVGLLDSRDNQPYVGDVMDELRFADHFAGRTFGQILGESENEGQVVSGASVTAGAVTSTVREMLRRFQADQPRREIPWLLIAGSAWIALGLVVTFHRRCSGPKARLSFAALSVVAGLMLGWMVGQDQLIGWGRNGLAPKVGLPLIILTAVALLTPAFTGKNVYCSRLCPHGAAQTLLGKALKRRYGLPARWHRVLQRVPWLTLFVIWVLALFGSGLPFALFEPFEVWSAGFYAFIPAAILTVGLLAAVFLPQAYCHYGCPTGALFKFLSHSPAELTRRDAVVAALVATGWIYQLAI